MRFRGPIAPSMMKKHPLTGEPIEPVGIVGGKYVWPCMGGAPDGDDDDDDGDSGADDDSKKSEDDKDDPASGGADDVVTRADYDALERRMRAADKRASELEAERKKAEDAKKDDLARATDQVKEMEERVTTLQSEVQSLRLQNAFLTANKHTWHDPEIALEMAQSKGYIEDDIVGEDGKVDKVRLGKALDRLAKEKAFLIKAEEKKKDDDDDDAPSGSSAGGRSDNAKDERAKKQQLKGRFPVLNR